MGSSIIIALPKIEDAKKIGELLTKRGYEITALCTTAASVLTQVNKLENGVVICSKRLPDMYYVQMAELMPEFFEMMLLTKAPELEDAPPSVVMVRMPVKPMELAGTLDAMLTVLRHKYRQAKPGPKQRSVEDRHIIDEAKARLMEVKDMTEPEAFRYIQKTSMDTGRSMTESAQMILMLNA